MKENGHSRPSRRAFLAGGISLAALGLAGPALAHSYSGQLPWVEGFGGPPPAVKPGGWYFFTPNEVRLMSAICDRLIPQDDLGAGGTEAGCVTFIDRQLIGSFGHASRLYTKGPFMPGIPQQGYQGSQDPAQRYRAALAAIAAFAEAKTPGKSFPQWSAEDQDAFLKDMEAGKVKLPKDVDGKTFFALLLENVMEGYFADPIYGGNRDMVSWKMIGFPGARYDYRAWVGKHNQKYTLPPVSIMGAADWSAKGN